MTQSEIDAFLAVYEAHSISLAAQKLYLSQPALSAVLAKLEKEIGTRLFRRGRGERAVQPSPAGKNFYPLAMEYRKLTKQMLSVGAIEEGRLRVATVSSISTYLFPPVFRRFAECCPQVQFETQNLDTEEAYRSLEQGLTDLAFAPGLRPSRTVLAYPAFSEEMCLIGSACALHDGIRPEELSTAEEIFSDWSLDFCRWHQEVFGEQELPRIRPGLADQIPFFLRNHQSWTIMPATAAASVCDHDGIRRFAPGFRIPRRVTYCLCRRESEPLTDVFLSCLREELAAFGEEITLLLPEKNAISL